MRRLALFLLSTSLLAAKARTPPPSFHSNPFLSSSEKKEEREDEKRTEARRKTLLERAFSSEELQVQLNNPSFSGGVLSTEEGGVITAPRMRVQAQRISYIHRVEEGIAIHRMTAEGDLQMQFAESAFIGSRLEFDFVKNTGTLFKGKTFVDYWFLSGERIDLHEDGTFYIYDASITTSESSPELWDVRAGNVKVHEDRYLTADNIRVRFLKTPLFWFPRLKSDLELFKDPPVHYKVRWDKGIGPRASMRYRLFSWNDFNLFFRLDYRLTRGLGGAVETNYKTPATLFRTKSYVAHDKSWPDEKKFPRYRFQGLVTTHTENNKTLFRASYDKFSDLKMPNDFRGDDFEVNSLMRSQLYLSHHEKWALSFLRFQPRLNSFQSLNEELPYFLGSVRPYRWPLGIIASHNLTASYLDYTFARALERTLPSLRSGRFSTKHELSRPITLAPFVITPKVGGTAIYYTRSPHQSIDSWLVIGDYSLNMKTTLEGSFKHYNHTVQPYINISGLTSPLTTPHHHFIFNIDDGMDRIDQTRIGVLQRVGSLKESVKLPVFTADLYTYLFVGRKPFDHALPRYYLDLRWDRPSYDLFGGFVWNEAKRCVDRSHVGADWTVSEAVALGVEWRQRSRFDWRKADYDNFLVDVTRSTDDLLASPLSDRRNTLIARFYTRLFHGISLLFQSHHGWDRKHEPAYNELRVDLFKRLTRAWVLRVGYQYTVNEPVQVTASLQISQ